jgi:hypothetical protein
MGAEVTYSVVVEKVIEVIVLVNAVTETEAMAKAMCLPGVARSIKVLSDDCYDER